MVIFYGVCGEGRGHAGRSFALANKLLSRGHEVHVFTFADGYDLFNLSDYPPRYLHEIEGLMWGADQHGISIIKTFGTCTKFIRKASKSKKYIEQTAEALKPDLILTDFEPLVARVARNRKLPLVTIDNQHRFLSTVPHSFPKGLRFYNAVVRNFIKLFIGKADHHIVTTFHDFQPLPNMIKTEVVLRDEITKHTPTNGDHILVYIHGGTYESVFQAMSEVDRQFIVYGSKGGNYSNIQYKPTSYFGFIKDLATCRAVISTAGVQLLGEAKYYNKKVLLLPIPKQHEQLVNAYFAQQEGIGDFCLPRKLTTDVIQNFLEMDFKQYQPLNGLDQIIEFLMSHYGNL